MTARMGSLAVATALAAHLAGCTGGKPSVSRDATAVADPAAPESPFTPPQDTLAGRPRTLDITTEDPGKPMDMGPAEPGETPDHSKMNMSTPAPSPKASATPDHSKMNMSTPAPSPKASATPDHSKMDMSTPKP